MPASRCRLASAGLPLAMAQASGQQELVGLCVDKLGCWCATQPDRGSDGLILYPAERYPGSMANKGNLQATFSGDEIVINGQSSAWVSNGPVAQVALMDIVADYGDGFHDKQGNTFGCNIIVPLDLKGVSRGKPLEKLGKRPLPQGEIFFDHVRVPKRFAIATRDDYELKHAHAWAHAGTAMSHIATGLARAAFELALTYVHERKQGGALLAALQLTQYRLGVHRHRRRNHPRDGSPCCALHALLAARASLLHGLGQGVLLPRDDARGGRVHAALWRRGPDPRIPD